MDTILEARQRRRLVVRGVVQGVGFRPFVTHLAAQNDLVGWCRNDSSAVVIEIEGDIEQVRAFEAELTSSAPPLARIEQVLTETLNPRREDSFRILSSRRATTAQGRTQIPADTAPCAECLREMRDPNNRRYRHPFITCTHCGPRFTIITDLPYDRATTTMAPFEMCPSCRAEYQDPDDRRYHAQPIGCHECGPTLSLVPSSGRTLPDGADPIAAAAALLHAGAIVAIKGLGGFHLACLAADEAAVRLLRQRKQRPEQPFAVMATDLEEAARLVEIGSAAETLAGPQRPIVLLPRRAHPQDHHPPVATAVAPGLDELGVMLPYTPVHELLLEAVGEAVVMTSGNITGEPLCIDNEEARQRLDAIADAFLLHDRAIAVSVEDSVIAWSEQSGQTVLRRSRGLAPSAVPVPGQRVVVAAGAEIKNTVAVHRDGLAFVSAHVGDLASWRSAQAHQKVAEQLLAFHQARPELVVADAHPGYASRDWACRTARELSVPLLEVQHHHAHLASLAAEQQHHGPLLGLVYDGTGYGCDGTIWGGELLLHRGAECDRLGHLGTVLLPGGDHGVRNPIRLAVVAVRDAGLEPPAALLDQLDEHEHRFLTGTTMPGVVATSSMGRLFDIVSALIGVRQRITYEAQAAIELEATARSWRRNHPNAAAPELSFPVSGGVMDPAPLVRALVKASVETVADSGALAWAFHEVVARASTQLAAEAAGQLGTDTVGLSGGCFANRILTELTCAHLTEAGLRPLTHRIVPPTDGGLALGQAAVGAASTLEENTCV